MLHYTRVVSEVTICDAYMEPFALSVLTASEDCKIAEQAASIFAENFKAFVRHPKYYQL